MELFQNMSVLRAVLDHEQPSEWTRMCQNCYSNSYLLFEVDKYSSEWNKVVACDSARHSVRSIKRVQNPFQLGLFKIQQEKRRSEYSNASSVIVIMIDNSWCNELRKVNIVYNDYRKVLEKFFGKVDESFIKAFYVQSWDYPNCLYLVRKWSSKINFTITWYFFSIFSMIWWSFNFNYLFATKEISNFENSTNWCQK